MNNIIYINIAKLNIEIHVHHFEYIYNLYKEYIIPKPKNIDIVVKTKKNNYPQGHESFCIFCNLISQLTKFKRLVLHAGTIEYKNKSYAFIAPPGTGKSTHINLWKQQLKDKLTIINGDKPILLIEDNKVFACGSPWCGKENLSTNKISQLKSVIFINRSIKNCIEQIEPINCFDAFVKQLEFFGNSNEERLLMLDFINEMAQYLSFYNLYCDTSLDAFKVSFEGLTKEKFIIGE